MVKIQNPKDLTPGCKYLILVFEITRVFVPGDERSKSNPGHGYPEHTDQYQTTKMYSTEDEAELQAELQKLYLQNKDRKDIVVLKIGGIVPVSVSLKIDFS